MSEIAFDNTSLFQLGDTIKAISEHAQELHAVGFSPQFLTDFVQESCSLSRGKHSAPAGIKKLKQKSFRI